MENVSGNSRKLAWAVGALAWYYGLRQAYLIGHDFGAEYIYVLATVVLGIYLNFETRREGTLSGYSLFNPNIERIAGSLTADEIDHQMRSGNMTTSGSDGSSSVSVPTPRRPLGIGHRLCSASDTSSAVTQVVGYDKSRDEDLAQKRRERQQQAAEAALRRRSMAIVPEASPPQQ
mmetsp:Transcript_8725/g.17266  ORF Transcript_8725/g.17266 Transcript_8725/m.17266 type:complete len:175 (-) Transcript_8725:44-568(-)